MIAYILEVWHVLRELAVWLLLGVAAAGVLHIFLPVDFVRRHLGKGTLRNVVKASLLGVPMPLCSCGVIPAAIGLKRDGASDGAAVAFLVSTPQTGLDSITVSAVFLGIPFALFKVFSAFITGLIGGLAIGATTPPATAAAAASPAPGRHKCRSLTECAAAWFDFAVDDLLYAVWKWIVLGILISAAISTFITEGALAASPWVTGLTGMVLMLIVSLPLYVCATASVPIAASLVTAGMPMGAALVFLMAGPATNIATLGAVYSEFGRRVTAIYLTVLAVCSITLGWLFNIYVGGRPHVEVDIGAHDSTWSIVGAVVLLILFAWFAVRDLRNWAHRRRAGAEIGAEEVVQLDVEGMSCAGCAGNVRNALLPQHGVHTVEVDLESGRVTVHGHSLRQWELTEAIQEAGYGVQDAHAPRKSA